MCVCVCVYFHLSLHSGACEYEGVFYEEGPLPSPDPCIILECLAGEISNSTIECVEDTMPDLWACADPRDACVKPDKCCLVCPSKG